MNDEPNKITAILKVIVTGEFYDDEASEETLRYCVEQDLEDAGFDVNVELLKEQEKVEPEVEVTNEIDRLYKCPKCHGYLFYDGQKYCDRCGQAVKWE